MERTRRHSGDELGCCVFHVKPQRHYCLRFTWNIRPQLEIGGALGSTPPRARC
jgi:hypothetical protein